MTQGRVATLRLLLVATVLLVVAACGERRFYPLMTFHPTERPNQRLDLGAVALTSTGLLVAMNEQDSTVLYEIAPYTDERGVTRSVDPLGDTFEDLFLYTDPSQSCPDEVHSPRFNRCRSRNYRAYVQMVPRAITWLNDPGAPSVPANVEDLSPYPCPAHDKGCETRVLGVTEFSTIGRITGFREDTVPRSREQLERVFVLERRDGAWSEVRSPEIEVLRQRLSDWGRANCEVDFVVEGVAYDRGSGTVYLGVNRCRGMAQTVLAYPLSDARAGANADLSVVAEGIHDARGRSVAGPSEGLSSLDWAHGHLWATSSWDDYGYPSERRYGGRLLVVEDRTLREVPLPATLKDRSDALAILTREVPEEVSDAPAEDLFPHLTALVLFDNDYGQRRRPNGTVVAASTPAPPAGRHVALQSLAHSPLGSLPVGLNSFDFEWYLRDHRLGYLGVVGGDLPRGPGAWTSELGGLWQVRLGMLGRGTSWAGKGTGHNRQAAGLTSYRDVEELTFTGYRAVISVVPGERTGEQVSIAQVLQEQHREYEIEAPLSRAASEGAGLVLQGFTIDTSPRAAGGICLAAMDLGVSWADPSARDRVRIRSLLLGGLCNDFNSRGAEEFHGLTTDPDAGVRVTLYFAVVEGAEARQGSLTAAQRDRPGERDGETRLVFEGPQMPPRAPYASPDAPLEIGNHHSKGNLACMVVDAPSKLAQALPWPERRHAPEPDTVEWMIRPTGDLPSGAGAGRGGSLSGFAFALDLRGFDPTLYPEGYDDVTELIARSQNVYLYRYLLRTWITPSSGLFLEGGLSHGLHVGGFGKDNAQPTALLVRSDFTWWDDLSADPAPYESVDNSRPALDPNLQPEDGYLRWSHTHPHHGELSCSPL